MLLVVIDNLFKIKSKQTILMHLMFSHDQN